MTTQLPGAVAGLSRRLDTVTETYAVRTGTSPVPTSARTGREIDKAVLPREVDVIADRAESGGSGWMIREVVIRGVHRRADGSHDPAPVTAVFDRESLRAGATAPSWASELAFAVEDRLRVEGDEELLTRRQAVDLLRSLGRPVTERSLANYNTNPPAGWPGGGALPRPDTALQRRQADRVRKKDPLTDEIATLFGQSGEQALVMTGWIGEHPGDGSDVAHLVLHPAGHGTAGKMRLLAESMGLLRSDAGPLPDVDADQTPR